MSTKDRLEAWEEELLACATKIALDCSGCAVANLTPVETNVFFHRIRTHVVLAFVVKWYSWFLSVEYSEQRLEFHIAIIYMMTECEINYATFRDIHHLIMQHK